MAHAPAGRRGLTRDKSNYRLLHMPLYVVGSGLLCVPANFPDHYYSLGLRIAVKQLERIQEICANDGIAADTDRRGLPNPPRCKLINRFISERPGSRNDSHRPFLVNLRGHDADLAMSRRNDARAVGPNQTRSAILLKLPGV